MSLSRHSAGKNAMQIFHGKIVGPAALSVTLVSAALLSQPTPGTPSSSAGLEFPVTLRQSVVSGRTVVGTKVQAKLVVATLVNGVVVPKDAILYGEVTNSAAKSATDPSRLGIRMDSARWKNGSAPLKVYLTAWYYQNATLTNENLEDASQGAPDNRAPGTRRRNPATTDPGAIPSAAQRFPGQSPNPRPPDPESGIAQRRVKMKDVESVHNPDGDVTLTSTHSDIKLDKHTTYVLAADGLVSAK